MILFDRETGHSPKRPAAPARPDRRAATRPRPRPARQDLHLRAPPGSSTAFQAGAWPPSSWWTRLPSSLSARPSCRFYSRPAIAIRAPSDRRASSVEVVCGPVNQAQGTIARFEPWMPWIGAAVGVVAATVGGAGFLAALALGGGTGLAVGYGFMRAMRTGRETAAASSPQRPARAEPLRAVLHVAREVAVVTLLVLVGSERDRYLPAVWSRVAECPGGVVRIRPSDVVVAEAAVEV